MPTISHRIVYMGGFNSQYTSWGYANNYMDSEVVTNWAEANKVHLLYDANDNKTFHSSKWQREYNPDLCVVSKDRLNRPFPSNRTVLNKFPGANTDQIS